MSDFLDKKRALEQAQQAYDAAVADERKRLAAQRDEIDRQIAELDKLTGTKTKSGRRSGVRDDVHAVIKGSADGMTPAQIKEAMGLTDRSGSQSVQNALGALKRLNRVTSEGGRYRSV